MSDDQMRGLKDLLREEDSGGEDVTTPVERGATPGRGLSALRGTAAATGTPAPSTVARPAASSPPSRRAASASPPAAPYTDTDRRPAAATATLSPRRKTSVTLPPVVRDRVAAAYHRGRWTVLALLELAGQRLARGEITRADVEATVTAFAEQGGSASIRSLSVPAELLGEFDERSTAWRLSRSALLAACLVLVLDDLPD